MNSSHAFVAFIEQPLPVNCFKGILKPMDNEFYLFSLRQKITFLLDLKYRYNLNKVLDL